MRPLENARRFTDALNLAPAQSPIVPLMLGEAATSLEAQRTLEREGFLVTAIRPPTVPAHTARLRFAFTAEHPDEEIMRLANVVRSAFCNDGLFDYSDRHRCRQDLRHRGLIRALREAGRKVSALKPVVSGFDIATSANSDSGRLLKPWKNR